MQVSSFFLYLTILLVIFSSGCIGETNSAIKASFSVSDDGILKLDIPAPLIKMEPIQKDGLVFVEELTFHTFEGEVNMILVTPDNPVGGLVWAPGAGVPASGHIAHLKTYAENGYAVLVVDIRGNGGKTRGYPMNIDVDYQKYLVGQWPQIYLIIADLIMAERYLHERYGSIPVWAVGESNGGRYACVATSINHDFFGYAGISTSGFGISGERYEDSARRFLLSLDPDTYAPGILPRPSLIFHAPSDQIIPFESGQKFAGLFGANAKFFPFNGTHGVNEEVDNLFLSHMATN